MTIFRRATRSWQRFRDHRKHFGDQLVPLVAVRYRQIESPSLRGTELILGEVERPTAEPKLAIDESTLGVTVPSQWNQSMLERNTFVGREYRAFVHADSWCCIENNNFLFDCDQPQN